MLIYQTANRLLPTRDKSEELRCELLEYSLEDADPTNQLYEALSYVWGSVLTLGLIWHFHGNVFKSLYERFYFLAIHSGEGQ